MTEYSEFNFNGFELYLNLTLYSVSRFITCTTKTILGLINIGIVPFLVQVQGYSTSNVLKFLFMYRYFSRYSEENYSF